MSNREIEGLEKNLLPKLNKYIPITPTPKQSAFLALSNVREAFYGGACGGGKSVALLAAALQYVEFAGYNAILFRKTFAELELPEALMDLASQWLFPFKKNHEVHYSDLKKRYTFPSSATLSFGYLDKFGDRLRYQSASFHFAGFDELSHFDKQDYIYLFSRVRRTKKLEAMEVPLRVRAASNPGGPGHEFIKQRFLTEGKEKGRVFIPAVLEDNPYLDKESYIENLNELDPLTRSQLLLGDWSVSGGGMVFKREWFEILNHYPVTTSYIPTVRYWDLAATEKGQGKRGYEPAYTVGLRMKKYKDFFLIDDIRRFQKNPNDVEKEILSTAISDGKSVEIWMETEPGSSGLKVIEDYKKLLSKFIFRGQKESGSKVLRAAKSAADAGNGKIKLMRGIWNNPFLDEVDFFPDSHFKDQVDALSGAHDKLNKFVSYSVIPRAVGQEQNSYWSQ
jgi:predicted phage terminase large subunit-like protein